MKIVQSAVSDHYQDWATKVVWGRFLAFALCGTRNKVSGADRQFCYLPDPPSSGHAQKSR